MKHLNYINENYKKIFYIDMMPERNYFHIDDILYENSHFIIGCDDQEIGIIDKKIISDPSVFTFDDFDNVSEFDEYDVLKLKSYTEAISILIKYRGKTKEEVENMTEYKEYLKYKKTKDFNL